VDLVVPYLQTNLEVRWNWAFRQTWCRSSWFGSSSTWGHSLGLGLCLRLGLRLYLRGCLRSSFGLDLKCSGHSHPKRGQNLYIWCIQWTRVYNHQISSTSTYIDTFWYHNTYLDTNLQQHLYSSEQFFAAPWPSLWQMPHQMRHSWGWWFSSSQPFHCQVSWETLRPSNKREHNEPSLSNQTWQRKNILINIWLVGWLFPTYGKKCSKPPTTYYFLINTSIYRIFSS